MNTSTNVRGTGNADQFSSLLNAEIRAEMGKQRLTLRRMEELTGLSKSRLGEAVNQDRAPLNTNELGRICEALRVAASEILRRAERALSLELEAEQALKVQSDYRLAAYRRPDTPEPQEEDYF